MYTGMELKTDKGDSYSDEEFEDDSEDENNRHPSSLLADTGDYLSEGSTPFRASLTPTRPCLKLPGRDLLPKRNRKLAFGRIQVKLYYASEDERQFKMIEGENSELAEFNGRKVRGRPQREMKMDELDDLDLFVSRRLRFKKLEVRSCAEGESFQTVDPGNSCAHADVSEWKKSEFRDDGGMFEEEDATLTSASGETANKWVISQEDVIGLASAVSKDILPISTHPVPKTKPLEPTTVLDVNKQETDDNGTSSQTSRSGSFNSDCIKDEDTKIDMSSSEKCFHSDQRKTSPANMKKELKSNIEPSTRAKDWKTERIGDKDAVRVAATSSDPSLGKTFLLGCHPAQSRSADMCKERSYTQKHPQGQCGKGWCEKRPQFCHSSGEGAACHKELVTDKYIQVVSSASELQDREGKPDTSTRLHTVPCEGPIADFAKAQNHTPNKAQVCTAIREVSRPQTDIDPSKFRSRQTTSRVEKVKRPNAFSGCRKRMVDGPRVGGKVKQRRPPDPQLMHDSPQNHNKTSSVPEPSSCSSHDLSTASPVLRKGTHLNSVHGPPVSTKAPFLPTPNASNAPREAPSQSEDLSRRSPLSTLNPDLRIQENEDCQEKGIISVIRHKLQSLRSRLACLNCFSNSPNL